MTQALAVLTLLAALVMLPTAAAEPEARPIVAQPGPPSGSDAAATCGRATDRDDESGDNACSAPKAARTAPVPAVLPRQTSSQLPAADTGPAQPPPQPAVQPVYAAKPDTRGAHPRAAAPGAHPGDVWVNITSKVYHCENTRYYGTTKDGHYMSEAAAKSRGFKGPRGKACAA